jgi:hypothetical protein
MGLISENPRALLLGLKVFTPGADDREVMTGRRHVLCRGYLRSSLGVVSPGHGENPALPWLIAGRTHRVCGGWSKAARRRCGRRDGRDRRRDGLPGGAGHRRRRDRAALRQLLRRTQRRDGVARSRVALGARGGARRQARPATEAGGASNGEAKRGARLDAALPPSWRRGFPEVYAESSASKPTRSGPNRMPAPVRTEYCASRVGDGFTALPPAL